MGPKVDVAAFSCFDFTGSFLTRKQLNKQIKHISVTGDSVPFLFIRQELSPWILINCQRPVPVPF